MARTKDSAQRYQTILSAAILLAEVVGWGNETKQIYPFSCHFVKNGSWEVVTTSTVDWPRVEVERWTQELRMHKLGH